MQTVRITGLTYKEVLELEKLVRNLDGVEDVRFTPVLPDMVIHRSLPPQMAVYSLHLIIRLAEDAADGVAVTAGHHLYKRVGRASWIRLGKLLVPA